MHTDDWGQRCASWLTLAPRGTSKTGTTTPLPPTHIRLRAPYARPGTDECARDYQRLGRQSKLQRHTGVSCLVVVSACAGRY
eukprot:3528700-Rhodomonas_salina.1